MHSAWISGAIFFTFVLGPSLIKAAGTTINSLLLIQAVYPRYYTQAARISIAVGITGVVRGWAVVFPGITAGQWSRCRPWRLSKA